MKVANTVCVFVSASLAWAASIDKAVAEAECGELGLMPASAHANGGDVRKCRDHPLGNPPVAEQRRDTVLPRALDKRCSTPLNSPWGCTRGYCWKGCGQEYKWCWTASNGGNGGWATCNSGNDCGFDDARFGCGSTCGC